MSEIDRIAQKWRVEMCAQDISISEAIRAALLEYGAGLTKQRDELMKALQWVGGHPYAGGRCFRDVEPVKSAIDAAIKEGS